MLLLSATCALCVASYASQEILMASNLNGKKIAILATDGFEQSELTEPRKALDQAGAKTVVIAPKSGSIKGWNHRTGAKASSVDQTLDQANPHELRRAGAAGRSDESGPLAHGPEGRGFCAQVRRPRENPLPQSVTVPGLLVEAGVVKGKTVTSWPSIKTDLMNAGQNGSTRKS